MERYLRQNNNHNPFKIFKELEGKRKCPLKAMRVQDGNIVSETEEVNVFLEVALPAAPQQGVPTPYNYIGCLHCYCQSRLFCVFLFLNDGHLTAFSPLYRYRARSDLK